jgi:hypothetical protein
LPCLALNTLSHNLEAGSRDTNRVPPSSCPLAAVIGSAALIPHLMPKKMSACPAWLGLTEDRTSFVLLADRAATVRMIFELSIAGLGGYTIAKQLNAKKVPVFGPSPKWDQSTIHNMLSNRATVGEHQPKQYRENKIFLVGNPIPNYYPAVIEESIFQAAKAARQTNLFSGRGRKGRLITNLFAGLPSCAYCGSPIKFYSNGNDKSFICSTVLARQGCYRMAWSYRNFERSFFELIKTICDSDQTIAQAEREHLDTLLRHIHALSGPNVYDARMGIAMALKASVTELKIASAGSFPNAGEPNAKIRRDGLGRQFEIRFRNGSAHCGFSIE